MAALANLIAGVARFITGVQVVSTAPAPERRQTVYFANHTSHLDFVVLWSSLPKGVREQTRPVAAQDYWDGGLRRKVAVDVFNALLVPRRTSRDAPTSAAKSIAHLIDGMGDRHSLIIFPEGTRGSGEEVAPFKSGLYHLCAEKPGLQLVPVYMDNLNRILPKGEYMPVPFIGRVTFGAPMALEPNEPKADFLTRARSAVCELKR